MRNDDMLQDVIVIAGKDPTLIDGGAESYLRAYGRAAVKAGYLPHHFCVSDRSDVENTEFGMVHRARSPFRPFRGLMVAAHGPYLVKCAENFAGQKIEPVLIHSFGGWGGVGVALAERLGKRGLECSTAITAFGTYAHETMGKLRGLRVRDKPVLWLRFGWELLWTRLTVDPSERRGYRRSSVVLVNYDSVREIITRQFGEGISFDKMTYASEMAFLRNDMPRGPLPEEIGALEPKDAPLIVAVSRHDPRKGLDVLLRALALLHARGVAFRACLVGGGALLESNRRLNKDLGLAVCTTLTGRVPDAYAYLQHADLFVLPSLEEGSGSVSLLEAMQACAPSVVSRVDGLPEDVVHEKTGLLVEPGDVEDLSRRLEQLLTNSNARQDMSRASNRLYRERFSSEAFATDLARVYTGLGFPPGRTSDAT